MITDIEGVRVGHWTNAEAQTGVTVILLPEGTLASGEVRGGAPATRDFDLLEPTRLVLHVNAVVLTGGSAFGLAAADGVMAFLAEQGVGFETAGGAVPIVVAMALFDLATGDGTVRPTAADGRQAAEVAATGVYESGLIGAGTGATVAKWRGREHAQPGGLVTGTIRGPDGLRVSTLIAVNSYGEPGADPRDVSPPHIGDAFTNTTIGVVVTNAALTKMQCHLVAQSAHDGLARSVAPSHTLVDGDAFVAAATCELEPADNATLAVVRNLATAVVEGAIRTLA